MADDFNEFVDGIADSLKRAVGPFGALFNPHSSKVTQDEVTALKARIARQDRMLDSQLDTINDNARKLRDAETERDALRAQLEALKNLGPADS